MIKLLLSTALLFISQIAMAHEGHGVAVNSIFHYLSAPHLLGFAGVALVAYTVWSIASRRRSHK